MARSRSHGRRLRRPVTGVLLPQGYRSRRARNLPLPLPPVRPDIGSNGPALRAYHPRRPDGTSTSSGQREASSTVSWWHLWHGTASERTPLARAAVAHRDALLGPAPGAVSGAQVMGWP